MKGQDSEGRRRTVNSLCLPSSARRPCDPFQADSLEDIPHVLELAEECGYSVRSAIDGVLLRKASSAGDVAALVLMENAGKVDAARQLVEEVREESQKSRPIIVIILWGPSLAEERQAVLEAQRQLMSAGASDVIIKDGGRDELELAISMSLLREKAKVAELRKLHRQLDELQEHVDLLQRQCDPAVNLFWKSVDLIFQSFPQLQPDIEPAPGSGSIVQEVKLEERFGKGTFGAVYGASNEETGEREAVKVIPKDRLFDLQEVSSVWKEIKVLGRLHHPSIVAFRGVIHGPKHIFIRMELVGRYNLCRAMSRAGGAFRVEVVKDFLQQLSAAIAYVNRIGVAHRDVKPENIALTDCLQKVKVLDFGSATASTKPCTDMAGTMPFMAPEVLEAEGCSQYDPSRVDVWALGVVLLEMLCGFGKLNRMVGWETMPDPDGRAAEDLKAFLSSHMIMDELSLSWDDASECEEVGALLDGMLRPDRDERFTAKQVADSTWLCLYDDTAS